MEQTKNLMLTDCAKEPRLEKAYRLLNLSEREFNAIRSGSLENLGADRTCLILDKALSWAARNYAGWDLYQYLREELGMSNEEISHAGFELDEFYEDETDYVNPTELTAELLNTLIEKILVHEAVKSEDGSREQEVEIFYRFIGKIE